jgi:hypothetical protein
MFVMVQPPDSVTTRVDVTMHSLMGAGKTQLLIVVEDQHSSNETSNAAWDETGKQLADYMIQCRKGDTHKRKVTGFLPHDMYGIANVGRNSRFYVLRSDEDTLRNHRPTEAGTSILRTTSWRLLQLSGACQENHSLWLPLVIVPIIFLVVFVFRRVPSVCQSNRRAWS